MKELNFSVIFSPDGIDEERVADWKSGKAGDLGYFEAEHKGVKISVVPSLGGGRYIRFFNQGEKAIVGFWGIRFPWSFGEDDYTLVPALFYNGNVQDLTNTVPMMKLPDSPVFNASFCSASFPAVLPKRGSAGVSYVLSPKSIAGWNGVELDADRQTLTFYAPAKEPDIYKFRAYKGSGRKPYSLEVGEMLTLRLDEDHFDCEQIGDLYDFYWNETIRKDHYRAENTPKISEDEGAALVRDWVYNRHCFFTDKNEPIISNAFTDVDDPTPKLCESFAEWNTMIGWCSGSMTALPLLYFGGKYRDFAVKYLDFAVANGNSPSGVKYPIYDGREWMSTRHKQYRAGRYDHARFYCDFLTYLGRSIRLEKSGGHRHPDWEAEFAKGIDILIGIWEREHDFGIYWDVSGEEVKLIRRGSCAGAFALLALAEAHRHASQSEKLTEVFCDACDFYYERCVKAGRCNGGPGDIKEADDSESAAALANALVEKCKLYGTSENLKMALEASELFASWVVSYAPRMPSGSLFENICVKGGVIANIQNRHVGPGICTNSARFLYDLGKLSGDERWTRLYYDIKAAAINCITTYDGEFYGRNPNEPFMRGMLSEQINLGDSLGTPGETWRVSACWPATAVLLGYIDK